MANADRRTAPSPNADHRELASAIRTLAGAAVLSTAGVDGLSRALAHVRQATEALTVSLNDLTGKTLYKVDINPA